MEERKNIIVAIERKGWSFPKLTIVVLGEAKSEKLARQMITDLIMTSYDKRIRGRVRQYSSMPIKEYRVVNEVGLKRLRAAAKASVTLRRKRAAKKAAETRKRNRERELVKLTTVKPPRFSPLLDLLE